MSCETPARIAVLASGSGTNLQALLDVTREGRAKGDVVVVLSNNPEAYALVRAREAGVETEVLLWEDYADREAFTEAIRGKLSLHRVDLVCLAGFMRVLSPSMVREYRYRIMNTHPALLPAFGGMGMYGRRVHEAVIASGARFSGATVHFVTEEPDAGPIICQRVVPVLDTDTPEDLAARIAPEEHQAYAEAVALFCEGRLEVRGLRVAHLTSAERKRG